MSVENRAKQFMPFAAVSGLPQALAQKEKIIVDKIQLTEDMAEELDWNMQGLEVGMMVTVVYFCKEEYLKKTGIVSRIDREARILQVVETKIEFDDLLKLEKI
ncbi:MAG: YolD-like family protein [Lachnospiraceae bacterium]|nr:YolD-like family protein [Lachnospiraceae bacterium]